MVTEPHSHKRPTLAWRGNSTVRPRGVTWCQKVSVAQGSIQVDHAFSFLRYTKHMYCLLLHAHIQIYTVYIYMHLFIHLFVYIHYIRISVWNILCNNIKRYCQLRNIIQQSAYHLHINNYLNIWQLVYYIHMMNMCNYMYTSSVNMCNAFDLFSISRAIDPRAIQARAPSPNLAKRHISRFYIRQKMHQRFLTICAPIWCFVWGAPFPT